MYTSIEIGNFGKEKASIIKEKINGKSYMNFQVICAPIGWEYHVSIETSYEDDPASIHGFLMYVMATEL